MRLASGGLLLALMCAMGCGSSDSGGEQSTGPAQGSERGACYPNGTCDPTLTCASGLCVSTSGGGGEGGSGGAKPETGGTSSGAGAPADGGEANGGESAGGSGGAPSVCLDVGEDCTATPQACCNATTCAVDQTTQIGVCSANCVTGTDCNSGCCVQLSNTSGAVCAPVSYCQTSCLPAGDSCAGGGVCCDDSICVQDAVSTTCAFICTSHAECTSGCCAPLDDVAVYVCSPPAFCL